MRRGHHESESAQALAEHLLLRRRILLAWLDAARTSEWNSRRNELLLGKRKCLLLFRSISAWRKATISQRLPRAPLSPSDPLAGEGALRHLNPDIRDPNESLPLPRSGRSTPRPHPLEAAGAGNSLPKSELEQERHGLREQRNTADEKDGRPRSRTAEEQTDVKRDGSSGGQVFASACQQVGVGRLLPEWWRQYRLEAMMLHRWRAIKRRRWARRREARYGWDGKLQAQ